MSTEPLRLSIVSTTSGLRVDSAWDGNNILTDRGLTCGGDLRTITSIMRQSSRVTQNEVATLNHLNSQIRTLAREAVGPALNSGSAVISIPLESSANPLEIACQTLRATNQPARRR